MKAKCYAQGTVSENLLLPMQINMLLRQLAAAACCCCCCALAVEEVTAVRGEPARQQQQHVSFEASGADGIRVTATIGKNKVLSDGRYPSALLPLRKPAGSSSSSSVDHGGHQFTNGNLRASLSENGLLAFQRVSDGVELLRELVPRKFTSTADAGYFAVDLVLRSYEGEALFGLGQHKTGVLDNKGQTFPLRPANTEILIPVVHSSRGYSFVWNLPSFGTVAATNDSTHWHATSAPLLDFWVCTTSANLSSTQSPWADRMSKFTAAVGRAPLFPRWVSGCKFARSSKTIHYICSSPCSVAR